MYGYDIFHEKQMYSLIKSIQCGTNNHAYIFCGETGMGRHIAAEMTAAALVCENTAQAPCGSCSACVQARAHSNPDISYVTAPKDKKSIGVDVIRALSDDCFVKPFLTKDKVYIVEGDMLTEAAQNAFLKTLEEPPEYAVFIILCGDMSKLLQTITSRCTVISFNALPSEVIRKFIKLKYPNETRIDFLANYSGGNPGKAEKIILDEKFETLRRLSLEKLTSLLSDRLLSSYQIAEFLEENKDDVLQILDFWMLFLRDILFLSEGLEEFTANKDMKEKLLTFISRFDMEKIIFAMDRITIAEQMSTRFVNLYALSLNLCLNVKNMQIFLPK